MHGCVTLSYGMVPRSTLYKFVWSLAAWSRDEKARESEPFCVMEILAASGSATLPTPQGLLDERFAKVLEQSSPLRQFRLPQQPAGHGPLGLSPPTACRRSPAPALGPASFPASSQAPTLHTNLSRS
jgi:hypothetical protein